MPLVPSAQLTLYVSLPVAAVPAGCEAQLVGDVNELDVMVMPLTPVTQAQATALAHRNNNAADKVSARVFPKNMYFIFFLHLLTAPYRVVFPRA